jgi:hypothetical protein
MQFLDQRMEEPVPPDAVDAFKGKLVAKEQRIRRAREKHHVAEIGSALPNVGNRYCCP